MSGIYIDDLGKGFPFVFVHGYLGSSEMWCFQKNYFSKHYRVIAPALPGFGESYKAKSLNSINDMANKIIEILKKLAAIDDDIAQEEIDLINQFSEKWGINLPELKPGKPEEVTNLVELKALVQAYLNEGPDTDVAEGLVDLINLMAEADDEVTEEEAMAVSEFTGMISHYVSSEKGGEIQMYEVNIVPQNDEQMDAVRELLPELNMVQDRGGKVFKVGRYFSEDYAEAVCKKYIERRRI